MVASKIVAPSGDMPIPDFQTLMLPVLRLADAGEIKVAEAVDRMADEFALTDQEREELLPSGRQAKIANRVHWAVTYLVKSGLVERPRRGYFAITPKGKSNFPRLHFLLNPCGAISCLPHSRRQ